MRLNVLVIDRAPPLSAVQGSELIARNVFPLLRAGHHLTLVAPAEAGEQAAARSALAEMFDEVRLIPRAHRPTALVGWLEPQLARRGVRTRGRLDSAGAARVSRTIRDVLAEGRIDVVHVRQLPMAGYATDVGTLPRLLELIDAETLATRRDPRRGIRAGVRRMVATAIERRAIRSYPIVTVVAEADAAALRASRPGLRVEVVPNGVDATRFQPRPDTTIVGDSVVFVGAMSFPPNVAAVRWFVEAVLPRLRDLRPGVTFTIVGRDPTEAVRALAADPAVTVTGSVDDVRPWLAGSAVVVAPMRSGSGIKNKILEAMAMGRPVVATAMAAEGLAGQAGRDLLVADGSDEFAQAVAELLADDARAASIAAAGRALVESTYTWQACADRYAALYRELAASRAARR